MAVDADDDPVPRRVDRYVEPVGRASDRVVDDTDPRVAVRQLGRDQGGPVARRTNGHHDLDLARVILVQDAGHSVSEMPFLVAYRHHHGDRRPLPGFEGFHDGEHPTAGLATVSAPHIEWPWAIAWRSVTPV